MTYSSRDGALAERTAVRWCGFDLVHNEWREGWYQNGTPLQVTAAGIERSSGAAGRGRLWEADQDRLQRADGWYVFVAYTPWRNGIRKDRS